MIRTTWVSLLLFGLVLAVSACVRSGEDDMASGEYRIVFYDEQGNAMSAADLSGATGKFRYEIVSDRHIEPEAQQLHDEGRTAGQAGEYERALELFKAASQVDPEWPYPHYDTAFTFLLIGRYAEAEASYQKVDVLAPRGFFTAKVAVDCLRREREKLVTSGTYLKFVRLEWEADPEIKRSVLRDLLETNPAFPAGWKLLATLEEDFGDGLTAVEQGLATSPDSETLGNLLIQKAIIFGQSGRETEATEILKKLLASPRCTIDNEALARILLGQLGS